MTGQAGHSLTGKRPTGTFSISVRSHKLRVHNAVPAQTGAPDDSLPPCGVHTFPPCRRHTVTRMRKEDGFPKGRECALKYAAGVRTRGERRYAIFERTVNDMPVAYRLAMEENRRLSILWFSVPFLKEPFVLLLRIVSSPPGCSGNETARVRRQPLWEKRFRRFS